MRGNWRISRRTFLRGVGAALALPLMETMGWADSARGKPYKPPVRLGFMYMPHGVIMDQFWPTDPATYLTAPPPILAPLQPVLDQCLVVKGVRGIPIAPFNATHALELSTWLTATLPDPDHRAIINIAISADQIAANFVGMETPLPSLELATMPQTHMEHQNGLHEGYYSHCSFRGPTQPLPAEVNPRNVLKRLFQSHDRHAAAGPMTDEDILNASMLDLVLESSKDLRAKVSRADQRKLDEYLDTVRSIERRIAAIQARQLEGARKDLGERSDSRTFAPLEPIDDTNMPVIDRYGRLRKGEKRSEYMQIMCDLNVLAFQADITRVSTYIGSTPNGVSYPELGFSELHHAVTHHNNAEAKVTKVAKINTFNVEQFAYMIKRMHALPEGEGTLLDNCVMMWGSGIEDGNKHGRDNLPVVIAGKGGGSINTGRYIPNVKGNQGDLLGTLLTCAGIELDRPIGAGTKLLTDIQAA